MNTPGGNTTAVAEHTLALLLTMARHIAVADATMKAGRWEKKRLSGRRAVRQDARRRSAWAASAARSLGGRLGFRHAGDRLRSLSHAARRPSVSACESVELDDLLAAQRLHHHPHAADGRHAAPAGRRRAGADQAGRAAHQLRARRHHRRAGAGPRAAERSRGAARRSTSSSRSRRRPTIRCCASSRWWSRRTWVRRPTRPRPPSRWPSPTRWPMRSSAPWWPTPSTCRRWTPRP